MFLPVLDGYDLLWKLVWDNKKREGWLVLMFGWSQLLRHFLFPKLTTLLIILQQVPKYCKNIFLFCVFDLSDLFYHVVKQVLCWWFEFEVKVCLCAFCFIVNHLMVQINVGDMSSYSAMYELTGLFIGVNIMFLKLFYFFG